MAGGDVSGPAHRPPGRDAVAGYLAAVAERLPGPAAARVAILDELRDGLLETLERQLARGRSPKEATAAAFAEFGDPPTVAAAFAPELAAVQGRRVALGLLASGPLVGLAWIAAAVANTLPPWPLDLTGPWLALPLLGLALVVAGPALALAIAATGRLGGRLGLGRRAALPPTAAAVAATAAVVADLALLAVLTGQTMTGPGPSVWAAVPLAVGASLTRAALAGRALRRCLAARAAVT
jgi:hypothetical protein